MRVRLVLVALAVLVLGGCTRSVVGVAAAERPGGVPMTPSISGTTWSGTDSEGDDYVFHFRPGGRVDFTSPSGSFVDDGDTWEQNGVSVKIVMSRGYATYRGAIDGDEMAGSADNIVQHSWRWSLHRQ